jgi:uroporphyrinogen decarboxylase
MTLGGRERFLRALRCEAVDRPPVWMMRQAGRTLPEYRALRAGRDFLTVMKDPALASEVTLQPVRRFGVDGAVIFSDILIIPEAMGMNLRFEAGDGPVLSPLLEAGPELRDIDPPSDLPWLGEAIRRVRAELGDGQAVLGFSGAPFTLLCYMTERPGKATAAGAKRWLFEDPARGRATLERLADQVIASLRFQVAQGADAVQLFDTWAGELAPEDYRAFVHPVNTRIVAEVSKVAPVLLYLKNGAHLLDDAIASGAPALAVDWRVDLPALARRLDAGGPARTALQGNLDPDVLMCGPDVVRARVQALHGALEGRRGHIFNLGHGLHPATPLASIAAFVEEVQQLGSDR